MHQRPIQPLPPLQMRWVNLDQEWGLTWHKTRLDMDSANRDREIYGIRINLAEYHRQPRKIGGQAITIRLRQFLGIHSERLEGKWQTYLEMLHRNFRRG